ncbi:MULTISPECIES: hypothetical protein [unclassified Herbaspirillum]|uniref:hypothetical protein n=1 Tax=unclassified Herbaspirillum TaxID=2624150 RepID=UPI0011516A29|nr:MULTISPECIES: hypothetical protein [unclassified Herbaspirillum]MBB5392776.1 hypothetical protein [Herbaspirillum sp. SJZ102]TQK04576.1 hypothetical protein FB599_3140 [Herbaspirillum sp. SJZ130]TQK09638.1 hypothetical protein FB598_2621 [Herbaspirillum sp. SJZ106]
MTSPQSVDYLRPKDWQHFERLCRALLSEVFGEQFQRWGRGGQRQNGLDAILMRRDGRTIGLQCKGRSTALGRKLTKSDVDDALKSIETLPVPIHEMIILTTASDDISLHEYVIDISQKRSVEGKCKVDVWGWDRISDQIGLHERIQHSFYKDWFRQLSLRQWSIRAMVGVLALTLGATCVYVFHQETSLKNKRTSVSIQELQTFVKLTDDLRSNYVACNNLLVDNIFTFSAKLKSSCIEPAGVNLEKIEKQIEKVEVLLDSNAWSEINSLSKLMSEDFRQSMIAAEMTRHFEDRLITELSGYCKGMARSHRDDEKATYQAAQVAMLEQLKYYFVLRDFILPGLTSMKARALVHARQLAGEPIPADLQRQANELASILKERRDYVSPDLKQPFTISAVKVWSSRSIKTPTDFADNPVELARWQEVHLAAATQALSGRPNDIEGLINCGVLKPEARQLQYPR